MKPYLEDNAGVHDFGVYDNTNILQVLPDVYLQEDSADFLLDLPEHIPADYPNLGDSYSRQSSDPEIDDVLRGIREAEINSHP